MNPDQDNNVNPSPAVNNNPQVAPPQPLVDGNSLPKTVITPTQPIPPEPAADLPVAAHMEGPPPAQAAPVVSNPNAAFAPQSAPNPATTTSPSPVSSGGVPAFQAPPTPIMTQNDMISASTAKRRSFFKKPLFIGGSALLVGVVTLAVLVMTNVLSLPFLGPLKTVTYDNGLGNTYKLKFYANHTAEDSDDNSLNIFSQSGQKGLLSKVDDGEYPVALTILAEDVTEEDKAEVEKLKTCDQEGYTTAFEASNKKLGNLHACSVAIFGNDMKDLIYMTVFEHNGKGHIVVIMSGVEFDDISSESEAKEIAEKASLEKHQDDLKKILGSIDPQ